MKKIVIIAITMLLFNIAKAQQPKIDVEPVKKGIVKGTVIDSKSKTPLEYANIVLKNREDSSVVGGTYSGKTGEFIISNIEEGKYHICASYVGYTTKEIPDVEVSGTSNEVNVGSITLDQSTVVMDGVTAEGERASEEFHLDKKVINVGKSLNTTGGTALDVLREQPSVRVDANDNVTLRGSSAFTVLVNGRPSIFQGSDALKQIPTNLIDNIEIITNPSAKYEAEGSAGIININMKKQTESTTSAIVNLGAGSRNKYNGDITGSHTSGSTTITGGFDYRKSTYYQTQNLDRTSAVPTGDIINNTIMNRKDTRDQYTIRLGIDYNINDNNLLSLTGSGGNIKNPRNLTFNVHNQSPLSDDYIYIKNGFNLNANFFNTALFYSYKMIPKISELTTEASYTFVNLPYSQLTEEYISDASYTSRFPNPLLNNLSTDIQRSEGRIKVNYSYKFNPQSNFECGLQSNFSYRKSDIENTLFDWNQNTWLVDSSLTNKFDFKNDVHAAFATYSNTIYDFNFHAGLRAEYMDRLLKQKTLDGDYKYDKLDLFPSFSISRKIDDHQLQFSYSRRINRPNEVLLNPFPYYSDSYLTSAGNPKLLPEYTNSFELNYQKPIYGIFFSVQTYLRKSTNSLWQTQSVDENGKLTLMFGNFAKTTSLGAEISSSIPVATWLKLDPNINLYNYSMSGSAFDKTVETESFTWTGRLNTTLNITPNTRVQITGMYFSKQIFPQSEIKPRFMLNVSAKQDFFDKALSLTLQGQNLLNTSNYDIKTQGSNFTNTYLVKPETPIINLTLTYNFNNFKRTGRQTERVDVNDGF